MYGAYFYVLAQVHTYLYSIPLILKKQSFKKWLVDFLFSKKWWLELPSEISIPNLPNWWRQNMNSVWTDHYQRPLLTIGLYPRRAEGWEKLQQHPLITNLPLCVKFGAKLIGIRIQSWFSNFKKQLSSSLTFQNHLCMYASYHFFEHFLKGLFNQFLSKI